MKKLSSYTVAKNCTDLADIKVGMDELMKYLKTEKKPLKTAYLRMHKLELKKKKLQGK